MVNFSDQKNHILYRLEKRELERSQFVNGKKQDEVKVRHSLDLDKPLDLVVTFSGGNVTVGAMAGQQQVTLDSFKTNAQSPGRFGFRVPGRDQIALSEFQYMPR